MELFYIVILFSCFKVFPCIIPPSETVEIIETPFFVYISDENYYCGGAIISQKVILTAGHCVKELMKEINKIQVTAGTTTPSYDNLNVQKRSVVEAIVHENYKLGENAVQAYNDIALLKVSQPFQWAWNVGRVTLGGFDPDLPLVAYGYGSTHITLNSPAQQLMKKIPSFIPDSHCKEILNSTKTKSIKQDYEICMTVSYCQGDSGSPLIQWQGGIQKAVGIASWVADDIYGCNTPPAVALHVMPFANWIRSAWMNLVKNDVFDGLFDIFNNTVYSSAQKVLP